MKRFFELIKGHGVCGRASSAELSSLIDGELAPSAEARVRRHLAGCSRCRNEYEELLFAQSAVNHLALFDDDFAVERQGWLAPASEADLRSEDRREARRRVAVVAPSASLLRRLLTRSIPIPAPLLAAGVLGVAVLLFLQLRVAPLASGARVEAVGLPSAVAPLVIEKPVTVERTIERVVTRTRYVERPAKRSAPREINGLQSATVARVNSEMLLPQPNTRAGKLAVTEVPQHSMKGALEGFEPTKDVKVTFIKERER